MTKLPRDLPPRKVIRALEKAGFYVRRTKGSHVIMQRDKPFAWTIVPVHSKVPAGVLREILKAADMKVEKFLELL